VVRRWIKLGDWSGQEATFSVPLKDVQSDGIDSVAVLVQSGWLLHRRSCSAQPSSRCADTGIKWPRRIANSPDGHGNRAAVASEKKAKRKRGRLKAGPEALGIEPYEN
jgi:hypothetical protein